MASGRERGRWWRSWGGTWIRKALKEEAPVFGDGLTGLKPMSETVARVQGLNSWVSGGGVYGPGREVVWAGGGGMSRLPGGCTDTWSHGEC